MRERGGVQGQDDETAHGAAGYIYWGELAPRKHQNTLEGPGRGVVVVNAAGIDTGCCATTPPPHRVSPPLLSFQGGACPCRSERDGHHPPRRAQWLVFQPMVMEVQGVTGHASVGIYELGAAKRRNNSAHSARPGRQGKGKIKQPGESSEIEIGHLGSGRPSPRGLRYTETWRLPPLPESSEKAHGTEKGSVSTKAGNGRPALHLLFGQGRMTRSMGMCPVPWDHGV